MGSLVTRDRNGRNIPLQFLQKINAITLKKELESRIRIRIRKNGF